MTKSASSASRRASRSFAIGLLAILAGLAQTGAAQDKSVLFSDDPGALATYGSIVSAYATLTGVSGLAGSISNGQTVVAPGNPGAGNVAVSYPAASSPIPGKNLIVVQNGGTVELIGLSGVHEWTHLSGGHELFGPNAPSNDAEWQAYACNELAAHCAALSTFDEWYSETGKKHSCAMKNAILGQIALHHLGCTSPGFIGPPSMPPPADACGSEEGDPNDAPCS